ncbi:hypothetical protein ALO46_102239 [Pseudomonas syringae pv. solidagae]|uniref:Uncharacterized protein n=2 Tax=Pseudomonas syringae group TaxID=136849 RepID=A0A3M5X239_9PSED|nr:hypothetical protein ALO46_102239 [Pseudomonas syringae pv. solidagae]RMT34624.1 hypothetical protein ALP49_102240 [Pseudomonas syringae pv. solidagae]RMT47673.1 hypothetical protein ALP48_102194 [Pseudomonas syringae pv. solidagae]RMU76692.1 hypothetical protein ALP23_101941 [Pseudomonas syringae pv. apii]
MESAGKQFRVHHEFFVQATGESGMRAAWRTPVRGISRK